jgi:hypothetical protein
MEEVKDIITRALWVAAAMGGVAVIIAAVLRYA